MDKDFNLDKVGKRMPYTTPEGFLDQLEANVWQEVKADMKMHQTKLRQISCNIQNDKKLCVKANIYSI